MNKRTSRESPLVVNAQSLLPEGRNCPWEFARVEKLYCPPFHNPELISNAHVFATVTDRAATAEYREKGVWRQQLFHPGELVIHPAGYIDKWRSSDEHYALAAYVDPKLVALTCAGFDLISDFEMHTAIGVTDVFILNCMQTLLDEAIQDYPSGALYGDSVASALAVHYLYRYGVRQAKPREVQGGLSKATLKVVTEYIEENSQRQIRLSELAGLAHLSAFHFSRLFKQSTGLSPYQYLMRVRVHRARVLMNRGDLSLKEVAGLVGFYDASHLSRIFKRVTGVRATDVFRQQSED